MIDDAPPAWPRAALSPRRRAHDRLPSFVWPIYALLVVFAVGYVVVEWLGVEWPWLDGWGVDGFEIVAGALCCSRAWTMRRARRAPASWRGPAVLGRRRPRPDDPPSW